MKMIVIFILIIMGLSTLPLDLFNFFAIHSLPFQKICENLSSDQLVFKNVQTSLLCGSRLISQDFIQPLKQHALIHLFVVSGGHFLFIEKLMRWLRIPVLAQFPTLFFYNILTGFQPPGIRSLTQMLVGRWKDTFSFTLREDQIQLMTGLFLLGVFPQLSQSVSFLLSWTAAQALGMSSFLFYRQDHFHKIFYSQVFISAVLFPWLWAFGNGHPLGVLSNLILGPWILFVLFPLSAAVALFPSVSWLFDSAVSSFEFILSHSAGVFISFPSSGIEMDFFWLYLFTLHLLFHWYQVQYWHDSH